MQPFGLVAHNALQRVTIADFEELCQKTMNFFAFLNIKLGTRAAVFFPLGSNRL